MSGIDLKPSAAHTDSVDTGGDLGSTGIQKPGLRAEAPAGLVKSGHKLSCR